MSMFERPKRLDSRQFWASEHDQELRCYTQFKCSSREKRGIEGKMQCGDTAPLPHVRTPHHQDCRLVGVMVLSWASRFLAVLIWLRPMSLYGGSTFQAIEFLCCIKAYPLTPKITYVKISNDLFARLTNLCKDPSLIGDVENTKIHPELRNISLKSRMTPCFDLSTRVGMLGFLTLQA